MLCKEKEMDGYVLYSKTISPFNASKSNARTSGEFSRWKISQFPWV